ncbi:hypothetical protein G6F37_008097 [Rhizopus arrhizus]|nr:hypothetical protein G6F38_005771 [Rhizopus arrhizus]KAG1155913.1 hypothetical protein G6F37_008097 [Rhizopus arrhizus]
MSIYNVSDEYMHCFNVMDEIPESDPMEIETVQNDLYNTVGLEWHYWGLPEISKKLLDLVIEGGLSARKAGMMVGIVERTAQHYVKLYRDDEEKYLPGLRKPRIKCHMKLEPQVTDFLCTFYGQNPEAVLWQARESLLQAFPEIKPISLSSLHKHLVQHASLTLKKLE